MFARCSHAEPVRPSPWLLSERRPDRKGAAARVQNDRAEPSQRRGLGGRGRRGVDVLERDDAGAGVRAYCGGSSPRFMQARGCTSKAKTRRDDPTSSYSQRSPGHRARLEFSNAHELQRPRRGGASFFYRARGGESRLPRFGRRRAEVRRLPEGPGMSRVLRSCIGSAVARLEPRGSAHSVFRRCRSRGERLITTRADDHVHTNLCSTPLTPALRHTLSAEARVGAPPNEQPPRQEKDSDQPPCEMAQHQKQDPEHDQGDGAIEAVDLRSMVVVIGGRSLSTER